MVRNIHQREYPVPAEQVGALLARAADPNSPVWPPGWPALVLDRPLGVGADGGHGLIRYRCTEWVPGRRVQFTLAPGSLLTGTHTFDVLDGKWPDSSILRHEIDARLHGMGYILWPVAIRWIHDAMIEAILDRTAVSLGHPPVTAVRPSRWVTFLRKVMSRRATAALADSTA
ncbi:hypothetical protein [Nocardia sp. NPDC005998]|uniref:hypothetical protein n=1 Tax=Nocardia sp. NPDC005998 TaxID=3156894 RepID=UPI0033BC1FCA